MGYTAKPLPPSNSLAMIGSAKKQSITSYLREVAPAITSVIDATRGDTDVDLSHVESIAVCDAMIAQVLERMEAASNAQEALSTFALSAFIDRFSKLTELRRKLTDSEIERRKYGAQLMEVDEVKRLAAEIVDSIRRHVRDPNTILKITGDIGRIVRGLSPEKPHVPAPEPPGMVGEIEIHDSGPDANEPDVIGPLSESELKQIKAAAARGDIGNPVNSHSEDEDPLAGEM